MNYYEYLDDNNQYGVYYLRGSINSFEHYRLYNVRPLAFIFDVFLISPFWNYLWIVLLVISLIQIVNTILLHNIFEQSGVSFGKIAILIFNLSPFLFESTYWISASSRIVISTFFSLISNYFLIKSVDKKLFIYIAVIFNLLAMCFYEQTIVFNFVFTIMIIFINRKRLKIQLYLIPIVSLVFISVWYIVSGLNGNMQTRGLLINSNFMQNSKDVLNQIIYNIINIQWIVLSKGFRYGIILLNKLILLVALPLFFTQKIYLEKEQKYITKFIIGILIFIAPFSIFFILDNTVINPRNTYYAILGIAIIFELIIELFLYCFQRIRNIIMTLILFALAIWFIPCNISELYNYKLYREFNNKTINDIISLISQDEFKDKKPVIVAYNVDILPKAISNHFAATIQMGWALMGEIQVKNGHTNIGKIMSIQREKAQDLVDSYKDKDYILIEEINNYFIRRK